MKDATKVIYDSFLSRYEFMRTIEPSFRQAFESVLKVYQNGGKVLICGNGGSAADADHIAGELSKGFRLKRPLSQEDIACFEAFGPEAVQLAHKLQGGLPAINLGAHTSLLTAIINDLGADAMYAQQVMAYGVSGDVFIGISTSGNSSNILYACITAKIKGLQTIMLTGGTGGKSVPLFDQLLIMPSNNTSDIQDMHSVVYHALCAMLETEFWSF